MEHDCFSVSEFHWSIQESEWRLHSSSEMTACGTLALKHTAGSKESKEKCCQQKTSFYCTTLLKYYVDCSMFYIPSGGSQWFFADLRPTQAHSHILKPNTGTETQKKNDLLYMVKGCNARDPVQISLNINTWQLVWDSVYHQKITLFCSYFRQIQCFLCLHSINFRLKTRKYSLLTAQTIQHRLADGKKKTLNGKQHTPFNLKILPCFSLKNATSALRETKKYRSASLCHSIFIKAFVFNSFLFLGWLLVRKDPEWTETVRHQKRLVLKWSIFPSIATE